MVTKKNQKKEKDKVVDFDIHTHLLRMTFKEPFYGILAMNITSKEDENIPTGGVGSKDGDLHLFYNKTWLSSLNDDQILGFLIHEFDHICNLHIVERRRNPHEVWNWATDAAINSTLSFERLPGEGIILPGKPVKDPSNPLQVLLAKLPLGKSSDWYFNVMMRDLPKEMTSEKMAAVSGLGMPGSGFENSASHDGWSSCEEGSADSEMIKGNIIEVLKKAANKCDRDGKWGSVSFEMQANIRKIISRQVDWRKLLRRFSGTSGSIDKSPSLKVINKRYQWIFGGLKKSRGSKVVIYVDQSGSVGNDDLALVGGELNSLSKKTAFDIIFFDTSVDTKSLFHWNKGRTLKHIKRTRYGGTDFSAPFNHFNKNFSKYGWDGMIIVTDGEASRPGSCRKKMAWLLVPDTNLLFEKYANESIIKMTKPKKS